MRRITIAGVAAVSLALAGPAQAHVTLQPKQAPADSFTRLNVRVPNESDRESTEKVRVQFPPGFHAVRYEPVKGWRIRVKKRDLDEPVELHGEQISEEVAEVSFAAQDGEEIGPGEFRDFGLSLRIPDKPNDTLTFKALQTYSDGEVVRWIGPPDSDEPAAQVEIIAAPQSGTETAAAVPAAAVTEDDSGPSTGLVIAAIVVGGLGLLAGLVGLLTARRARR
jgi:uncharacterized protein YcnI